VEDDEAGLAELRRVCRPGGFVFLNLPAHAWLAADHDRAIHTARRYARRDLRRLAARTGLVASAGLCADIATGRSDPQQGGAPGTELPQALQPDRRFRAVPADEPFDCAVRQHKRAVAGLGARRPLHPDHSGEDKRRPA